MIVKVTQEDIDQGRINDNGYCMVARAINRTLNTQSSVGYSKYGVFYDNPDEDRYFVERRDLFRADKVYLSKSVTDKIKLFDKGEKANIKPFNFRLEVK